MTTRDLHARNEPRPSRADSGPGEPTQPLDREPGAPELGEPSAAPERRPATLTAPERSPRQAGDRARPPGMPVDDVGRVLGSYRLVELLGKGGMGYVFRAEHTRLGREVAIKLLRRELASRRDAVARFFQEARTVNLARHRNIVDVTDFVELDDGTTYIVMELLAGTSLGRWAEGKIEGRAEGRIELSRALAVLVQICDGLSAAHQVGVVHRDLKPDNIVIVPSETGDLAKLVDFGVAKLVNHDDPDLGAQTAAGAVIGTPAYMSPEQAGGLLVDARSDIYSLGAIMYELFAGQPMFRGRSFGEYVRMHLTELPVRPRQTPGGAALDPRLEAVILRCIEKDPEQRFATAGQLREILRALRAELAHRAPVERLTTTPVRPSDGTISLPLAEPAPRSVTAVAAPPLTLEGDDRLPARPRRPRRPRRPLRWLWLAGAAAVAVLGTTAVLRSSRRAAPEAPRSPAADVSLHGRPGDTTMVGEPATAAATPPPARRPALIELRFEATPDGAVFTEGRSTELCRTPCAFDIDPADGGSTTRRGFVVRRAGYIDRPVVVDLTGAQRAFHVVLQPLSSRHTSGR